MKIMKGAWLFILLYLSLPLLMKAQNIINTGDTYVLVSGVLSWQDSTIRSFDTTHRKDKEFYNVLKSYSVAEDHIKLLLDKDATKDNILNSLDEMLEKTGENSTLVFYYAGHGVKQGKNYYFCNYDYGSKEKSKLNIASIGKKILKKFKGKRIILMADCCYSGALIHEGESLSKAGKEVIVLTSATASNISTGNWTFTQTIIDNFKGNSEGDHDKNSEVSLKELKREVFDAMRFRERQLAGYYISSTLAEDKIIVSKLRSGVRKEIITVEDLTTDQYVYALTRGNWQVARVKNMHITDIKVEFYEYSDKREEIIHKKYVKAIETPDYSKYTTVQVEWNKKYYPAEIKKNDGDFYFVHYPGYDDSWNEWVMYDRIKTGDEKKAMGKWQLGWYKIEILQEKDDRFFITYTGYDHTWDEWAGKERIKQ